MKKIFEKIFHIQNTTDAQATITHIGNGIIIKGYNLWLLICSALLASIGLDTDSTAVIIGAMLISPLMSPILGVGLSLGINDRTMLVQSAKNLSVAVFISLLTSFLYFLITPLGQPTTEIMSRTQPTLLDIGIAFFGGVAGIIAISRSDQTAAIPGVAIATALMPPLCTTGYGLAKGNFSIFGGAFYLFTINAIFISLSTYLIVKYLDFPLKEFLDKKIKRRVERWTAVLLFIICLPSLFFLYSSYHKIKIQQTIQNSVITPFNNSGYEVLKWELEKTDSINYIKIYLSGNPVAEGETHKYDSLLNRKGLGSYRLKLSRVNLTREEISKMSSEVASGLLKENSINTQKLDSAVQKSKLPDVEELNKEISVAFPKVANIWGGKIVAGSKTASNDTLDIFLVKYKPIHKHDDTTGLRTQLRKYLQLRVKLDTLVLKEE